MFMTLFNIIVLYVLFVNLHSREIVAAKMITDVHYVHQVHSSHRTSHHSHKIHRAEESEITDDLRRLRRFERVAEPVGRRKRQIMERKFEAEVKTVQNSSICSYWTEPVMENTNIEQLMHLQHIRCNKTGHRCHSPHENYYCVQTYRTIDIQLENGGKHQMKIYTGCVCASHFHQAKNVVKPLKMS